MKFAMRNFLIYTVVFSMTVNVWAQIPPGDRSADNAGSDGRPRRVADSTAAQCPFLTASTDASQLINQVRGHLTSLRQQNNEQCGALNTQVDNISRSFESLQTTVSNQAIPTAPGEIGCTNYENRLRSEYDLAVAMAEGTEASFVSNSFYDECRNRSRASETGEANMAACLSQQYSTALSSRSRFCDSQNQQALNAETRRNLDNIAGSLESLVRSDGAGCGPVAGQVILQSALQQGSAALALAQGAGLAGVGISIMGRLLSAIAGRIFENRDSIDRLLRNIDNDRNRPTIQCMYYNLQQAVLNCEQPGNKGSAEVAAPTVQAELSAEQRECSATINQLNSLRAFSRNVLGWVTPIEQETEATRRARNEGATRSYDSFYELMFERNNTPKRLFAGGPAVQDLYGRMATQLSTSPRATDQQQGQALQRVLTRFQAIQLGQVTGPEATTAVQDLGMQLAGLSGDPPLNISDMIDRYQQLRESTDTTFATALNDSRMRESAMTAANGTAEREREQSQREQDISPMSTALYSLVNTPQVRQVFVNRLTQLENNWIAVQGTNNATNKMAVLNEMLALCNTTQGMAYFHDNSRSRETVATFSRQRSDAEPYLGREGRPSICSKFVCAGSNSNNELFRPFDPNNTEYGNGAISDRFRQYQCASSRAHTARLLRLRQNIEASSNPSTPRTNQICGQ